MRPFRTKEERLAQEKEANLKAFHAAEVTPANRPPMTHAYGRASTGKQEHSPETQKAAMAAYIASHKLPNPAYYIDPATSGSTPWNERHAGGEMFRRMRRGDTVIIAKLDRAFRSLKDCCDVMEKFKRMGIKFHICNLMGASIDFDSALGMLLVKILAAFAEFERALISERTKEGIRNRKHNGFKHSRHPGYGFNWEKRWTKGKWEKFRVANQAERQVMKSILLWRLQDDPLSWASIRDHLATLNILTKDGDPWTEQRVRRACRAEMLLRIKEESIGRGTD